MATTTERLALLIDADAKGAIKELQSVGKHASTEMAKTETAIGRAGSRFADIGVGAIAFGAAVGVGAKKAIDAAQNLADAQDKANATFSKEGVQAVDKFAANAADKFGLSKQQATDLASTYGNIGKAFHVNEADLGSFSTTLAGLTSDLAEFSGKSTEEVQAAIKSGLSGKGKALREFGIDLEAGSKGIDAYNQILEQTRDKQGFFASQSDDVGASQERLKAKFENTKAALGDALIPVMSQGITIVGGVVDAFNSLPGPLQSIIVGAGITAAGLKAVGIDFGDVTKLVGKGGDAWQKYGVDASGGLTKAGAAVTALGAVFAGAAIIETVGAISDAFKDVEVRGENAMNKIAIAVGNGSNPLAAFREQVQVTEDSFDWTSTLDQISLGLGSATGAIDRFSLAGQGAVGYASDFQTAFDNLFTSKGADAAQGVVDALRQQNDALDHSSDSYKSTNDLLDQWQERLDLATGAQKVNTDAVKGAKGGYDAYTGAVDGSVQALKDYTDAIKAATDPLFAVVDGQKKLTDAQNKAKSAELELTAAIRDHGPASLEAAAAQDALSSAQEDAVKAGLDLNSTLSTLQQKVEDGSVSMADAKKYLEQLRAQYPELGSAIESVEGKFEGATKAGDKFAKDYEATVTADFSDFYKKYAAAQKLSRQFTLGGNSPGQNNADRQNAVGGVMAAGERSWVGENGPEIFQAGSSGYVIPNNRVTGSAMRPHGGDGTSITYEINVSVSPGSEADAGRALVDAIKAHERIAGPGWRQ